MPVTISTAFDALSRNPQFYERCLEKTDDLLLELGRLCIPDTAIKTGAESIKRIANVFQETSLELIPVNELNSVLDEILSCVSEKITALHAVDKASADYEKATNDVYKYYKADGCLNRYKIFLNSQELQAANCPYILLHSEGGYGKSHLIGDCITQRNLDHQKSLLFLGQHFPKDVEPFAAILDMLQLHCTVDEFLNKLNSLAKAEGTRVVIFIDALNEGNGKEIWKHHLPGMITRLEQYPYIGLVVSIRTEYMRTLFDEQKTLQSHMISVRHTGFSEVEYEAIQKYFDFYNIHYLDIPFTITEFRNPLFLRLVCEAYQNNSINLSELTLVDAYKNYLKAINSQLADICNYSRRIDVVGQLLEKFVLKKYEHASENNLITLEDAITIVSALETQYHIQEPLLDALFSVGLLTESMGYKGNEYVHVTYEKMEDYLYAQLLVNDLSQIGVDSFKEKYKFIGYRPDLLEMLAIRLSETKWELFDVVPDTAFQQSVVESFCHALRWRKAESITDKTFEWINGRVLRSYEGQIAFYETIFILAAKPNHPLNAGKFAAHLLAIPMPDRDARYIPLFDELAYESSSPLNRLIDWGLSRVKRGNVSQESVQLMSLALSMVLITSNRALRDRATKSIMGLLVGRTDTLIALLDRHAQTDDPYILERLYAIAFGCITKETDKGSIEKLALYVYYAIFDKELVYPNIRLRDYAKNIIEFAKYTCNSPNLSVLDIRPPYGSGFPAIPSDKEISAYELDYNSKDYKKYHSSQNQILSSMRVEYTRNNRCGLYGDFGRYTFQAYFSYFEGLNYNDLMNIAVKRIFDMGYDVEKHGRYDKQIPYDGINQKTKERIGKKYQWIAFMELAAQVADHYQLEDQSDFSSKKESIFWISTAEPHLRDIDPTLWPILEKQPLKQDVHNRLFQIKAESDEQWLSTIDDLPSVPNMLQLSLHERKFLLLTGWYNWSEKGNLGERKYSTPTKNMWVQINGYFVSEDVYEDAIKFLENKNFMGRWLVETSENYSLYNREYDWSSAYGQSLAPYYGGNGWKELGGMSCDEGDSPKVLLPTRRYLSERKADASEEESSCSWYKPCEELVRDLGLQYGDENTVLYDASGEIVCFDSSELLREKIGFFIDEASLSQFLTQNKYKLVWTILAEKQVIRDDLNRRRIDPTVSRVYTYESGTIIENSVAEFLSE